jgi:putative endonuclease
MPDWHLYVVRCSDGSLYTGISTDVARRLREHRGNGTRRASYMRSRTALDVVFAKQLPDRAAASRAEYAVKQLQKAQKELLVAGLLSLDDVLGKHAQRHGAAHSN